MDKFSSKHFIFLILGTAIVSMKTYPETFMKNGGRDSWIAIVISSILVFIYLIYVLNKWKRAGEDNFVEVYRKSLGKGLGNAALFLFLVVLFITLVECASMEADSMHENMLLETPKWYYLLFFIIPCIYVLLQDIVAEVIVTIIGIALIMVAGINLAILTSSYKQFALLLPIFENGINSGFFTCIIKSLGLYGCASIALPYLKFIKDDNKKLIRNSIIALIILTQMQIVSVTGILMTFGPDRSSVMNYPKLLQTQQVSYVQFLEFGELYVMLQILGGWLLKYLLTFYAILIILRDMKVSKKHMRIIIIAISAFAYLTAFFAANDMLVLFSLLNYYEYLCLANFVIIPVIVFTLYGRKADTSLQKQ